MFDIGWSELLLVAVLAIVFVGPKDLPRVMRTAGQYMARMRAMAREFQQSFEDLARESELDELRKEVEDLRRHPVMTPLEAPVRTEAETVEEAKPAAEPSGEPPLSARLPEDIDPGMADAIREAEEIEAFGRTPNDRSSKPETGQA